MNEPTTNQNVITYVTGTVCALAFICVITFCILCFKGIEVSQAFSLLTGGLVGSLTSMLVKTTPTETTKQPAPTSTDNPLPVKPITSVADPVHTEEATQPTTPL
jgi:hypothetical protein